MKIAIQVGARVTIKRGGVAFGLPRNRREAPVSWSVEEFDRMSDDDVIAALRQAWGQA